VKHYAVLFVRTIVDVEENGLRKFMGEKGDSSQRTKGEQNIYWNTNMYVQGAQGE